MSKFIDRIGEENYNNQGCLMKIVEYNNCENILIEFQDNYKAILTGKYGNFKRGNIINPYHRSVCGIGYMGIGTYFARINNVVTAQYMKWQHMLQRCYREKSLFRRPTYRGCYVCGEWQNFQIFAAWYDDNYYECGNEKMRLDKDILAKRNKIYSPETCVFVPDNINLLFITRKNLRGKYPIGVSCAGNKFRACYSNNRTEIFLGCHDTPTAAFQVYKKAKEDYIKDVADEYKSKYPQFPQKLYEAMYKYEVEIDD